MDPVTALILGVLQGLTEFLPVSSSGHLVLGGVVLGLSEPHLLYDVVVHAATLVATMVFYRQSLVGMAKQAVSAPTQIEGDTDVRLALMIIIGSVPTGLIGVLFKDPLEALFAQPKVPAAMLIVTAGLLLVTRFVAPGNRSVGQMRWWQALVIGTVQGLAIIPGISRSGSTIAAGLILGLDRELAARYSFLLSLPAILGALMLKLMDGDAHGIGALPLVLGFVSAAGVGVVALKVLIPMVKRGQLHWFAAYLVPAGIVGLVLL